MNFFNSYIKKYLQRSYNAPGVSLSEFLVKEKIITMSQLQRALEHQENKGQTLCQSVVELEYARETDLLQAISLYYKVPITTLSEDIEELVKRRNLTFREFLSGFRMPIWAKLSIAITVLLGITILVLSFIILARQNEHLYQQTVKTGKVSIAYFTDSARVPLLNDDILRLNTLIKETSSVDGLLYAIIADRDKEIKAHTDHTKIGTTVQLLDNIEKITTEGNLTYYNYTNADGVKVLNLSSPVKFKNKELGEVHVGISLDFIKKQMRKEGLFILLLSLLIVIVGITVSILMGLSFSRPISELVLATHEIGRGNFNHRIEPVRKDEFGILFEAFNYMSQELWKKLVMQKSFGRYVSPEILDLILANPEESLLKGARSEATVLFADIRGFTHYSETREPESIVEDLNEFFSIVTRVILEYGGYVDKFIGDAVLCIFCVPLFHEDHAERALRAAVAMQRELQRANNKENELLSKVGIGINSGVVVSGSIGSQNKMEYTVIGDNVNIASRTNSLADAGEIIMTRSTYNRVRDIAIVKELPPQNVKGKAEPLEVFQVLDIK